VAGAIHKWEAPVPVSPPATARARHGVDPDISLDRSRREMSYTWASSVETFARRWKEKERWQS